MSEETNNQETGEMNPEQIAEQLKNMHEYYDEQIVLLGKEREYNKLIADIEEQQLRALTMRIRKAQLMAGPPKESPKEEETSQDTPEAERPVRKLRKD